MKQSHVRISHFLLAPGHFINDGLAHREDGAVEIPFGSLEEGLMSVHVLVRPVHPDCRVRRVDTLVIVSLMLLDDGI